MLITKTRLKKIIKEELNNVLRELDGVHNPSKEFDEYLGLQQEGLAELVLAFVAAVGINQADIPQDANFNINGEVVSVEQMAQAYDMLDVVGDKNPDISDLTDLGKEDLTDIVRNGVLQGDQDGDGTYGGNNKLRDFDSSSSPNHYGEAYADLAIDKVLAKSQAPSADAAPDTDISQYNVEKGQSPQGDTQLKIELPQGKRLTQGELSQIAKANGISSFSTINNTGLGMVIITAN